MKKIFLVTLILIIAALFVAFCSKDSFSPQEQSLSGPYLGQKPPGMEPELFAPGIISKTNTREFAITFSPDGKECFFTRSMSNNFIMTAKEVNGKWADPAVADFSGRYFDFEPHITHDGSRLYFGSMRPLSGTGQSGELHQWYRDKTESGWSSSQALGSPFRERFVMYISVTSDGTIYFTGDDGIYFSKLESNSYQKPVKMDDNINYIQYSAHPFIAPDESYLIYDAQPQENNADLYISFKQTDGTWSKSVSMGEGFNTANEEELCAYVSSDGKYLFFSRITNTTGDIYWVDADIIDNYR